MSLQVKGDDGLSIKGLDRPPQNLRLSFPHSILPMKSLLQPFRPTMFLLALTLLCGGAASTRATPETFSLTFDNAVTSTPVSLTADDGKIIVVSTKAKFMILPGNKVYSFSPVSSATAGLFGSVNDLQFKQTKSGSAARAKAVVSLFNGSDTALQNVTATVYVSNDNTLSADDTALFTLRLSDYGSGGEIGKHKIFSLPLNEKVPTLLASYLNGKYLIVVLGADNLGTLPTAPVVVGPITLP